MLDDKSRVRVIVPGMEPLECFPGLPQHILSIDFKIQALERLEEEEAGLKIAEGNPRKVEKRFRGHPVASNLCPSSREAGFRHHGGIQKQDYVVAERVYGMRYGRSVDRLCTSVHFAGLPDVCPSSAKTSKAVDNAVCFSLLRKHPESCILRYHRKTLNASDHEVRGERRGEPELQKWRFPCVQYIFRNL